MTAVHVRVPDPLADAARSASGLGADAPMGAVTRWALARSAGWPDAAAQMAAGVRSNETETEAGE
jgi:hypothetical protein